MIAQSILFVTLLLLIDCLIAAYLWRRMEDKVSDFKCPHCGTEQTWVKDVRANQVGLRRRRECPGCNERFTTLETVVVSLSQQIEARQAELRGLLAELATLREKIDGVRNEIAALEIKQRVTEASPRQPIVKKKRGRPRKRTEKPAPLIPISSLQDLKNLPEDRRRQAIDEALRRAKARIEREKNGNGYRS